LQVRPSSIVNGGLGVFAVNHIKKGTWLTEYGGEIIDVEEARMRRDYGNDTHIRSCGRECLYGRMVR
jgi:SET domain-containing protein